MSVVPMIGPVGASERTGARLLLATVGLARGTLASIVREIRVRRDMRRLAEFDDYMLRDIGITRLDIEGAVRRGHDALDDGRR